MFKYLSKDLPSSVVVFLVALPLCLGIALASGAPLFSGLISGIVGGVVIGFLSGSNLSVSGPAAGLAALVLAAINNIGDFRLFLCAVVLAGAFQILMGMAKLGGIANYFPSAVIKGMLTSIGILIIAKQIPHAFGYDRDEKGHLTELFPFGNEDWHELLKPFQHVDLGVCFICIVSVLIMVVWEKPQIKKHMTFIPGALVAVIVSIIIDKIFKATGSMFALANDHLVQIEIPKSIADFGQYFTFPKFEGFAQSKIIVTGLMIAIIASLETMLSIEAIDSMDPERHVTNKNRELLAQGTGNILAGLIGGLPITSVIVRSTANLNSGAKTKLSSILHGVLLLVCVVSIPHLLNLIPLSSLAAILLITGYKLCKLSVFKEIYHKGKYQFIPFMVTVGVIIGIDLLGLYKPFKGEGLLVGVVCGLISAVISLIISNAKNSHSVEFQVDGADKNTTITLSEEVSFLNKAKIKSELDHIVEGTQLTINAVNTKYIDNDVLEIIKEFRDIKAPLKNIKLLLIGFHESYKLT